MHEWEATKPQQNTANPQPFCIFCIIWDLMKHQKLRLVCNSFTYSVLSGEPRHLKKNSATPQAFCILCISWEGMKSYSLCGEEARIVIATLPRITFNSSSLQDTRVHFLNPLWLLRSMGSFFIYWVPWNGGEGQGTRKNRVN